MIAPYPVKAGSRIISGDQRAFRPVSATRMQAISLKASSGDITTGYIFGRHLRDLVKGLRTCFKQ